MRRPMPVDFKVSQILPLLKFDFAVVFQRRFPDSAKHQCYIFFNIYFFGKIVLYLQRSSINDF